MKKQDYFKIKKKYIYNFVFIILIIVLVISLYSMNQNKINEEVDGQKESEDQIKENNREDQFSNIKEMHFDHMPITYNLYVNASEYHIGAGKIINRAKNTDDYKIARIKWALDLIENSTEGLIKFKEVKEDETPDIRIYGVPEIYCYQEDEDYDGREGFAGPENYFDNEIINSTVVFCATGYFLEENLGFSWKYGECEAFPIVELHEIFHALGFGHTLTNNKEVMYPIKFRIRSCEINQIDGEIISCLKYIYSDGKIAGDCSNRNMFPWPNETDSVDDFRWDSLPVSYSIFDCNDNQKKNIRLAEGILEEYAGFNLYEHKEDGARVNFYCKDSFEDIVLNRDTDFWTTTDYFPAALPEYSFGEDGKIKEVKVTFFAQNRYCGGIELHEMLHGLGLRNHYGDWMFYERGVCSKDGVIDKDSIKELKEIYSL